MQEHLRGPFQLYTIAFMLAVLTAIAVYDVWTWKKHGVESTITRVLRGWGERYGWVPYFVAFGMGCLFGHVFL